MFFNNLQSYDGHLIVKEIAVYLDIAIIPIGINMERYLEITCGRHMVFCDSLQFLAQSLQTLDDFVVKCDKPNKQTKFSMLMRLICARYPTGPWKQLICKGLFPYEHVNTFATLDEQQLPQRTNFNSTLSGDQCSEDDYGYANSSNINSALACCVST